ncbi:nitrate/nitrite transporter [Paraburkholderia sp. DHOC27]|uniref:MFS transporter n=1 Tax=Paraburkholderia sp. DHOC27 TaxID=2303330 RepID=UPI000E3B683C|nr:MFS transporter [Paraburkholderia sp. DHOC27]RFU48450.1 MFS transporter [Paraburkholderia sp. DHOC27]
MADSSRVSPEQRNDGTSFLRDYGLWALTFSYVLSQFFRSYVAVIATQLIADFRFSAEMFGWFAGAFFLVFALAQIPVGVLFDRYGVRVPTAALMALGTLSAALLMVTTNPWSAIAAQAGIGLGCAPIFMGLLNYVLSSGAGPRQTSAITTASAIGMAGALLAAWPLSRATAESGWRAPMLAATVAMLAATLVVIVFVKRRPPVLHATDSTQTTQRHRAMQPETGRFWALAPACLAMSVGATFRTSWGGPYLADVFGFDLLARGNAMTITSIVATVASFCVPLMVRRWAPKWISLTWLIVGAIAAVMLALFPGVSGVLGVALICVLFSVGAIHPLVMSQARAIVVPERLGLALGFLNSLVFLGVALASGCFGWIAGHARLAHATPARIYASLFAVTALPLAFGAAVYVLSPRTGAPRARHRA